MSRRNPTVHPVDLDALQGGGGVLVSACKLHSSFPIWSTNIGNISSSFSLTKRTSNSIPGGAITETPIGMHPSLWIFKKKLCCTYPIVFTLERQLVHVLLNEQTGSHVN